MAVATQAHTVRFCESDRSLAVIVAQFLVDGLAAGNPGIVVATPVQQAVVILELDCRSMDVVQLQRSHDLVLLDARDTLATFMTNDIPDAERFTSCMHDVIARACRGRDGCAVRIYGQMVDILWGEGRYDAAIRLEMLWTKLAATRAFSVTCGESMGHFYADVSLAEIRR
jgi:hypothetical protein